MTNGGIELGDFLRLHRWKNISLSVSLSLSHDPSFLYPSVLLAFLPYLSVNAILVFLFVCFLLFSWNFELPHVIENVGSWASFT